MGALPPQFAQRHSCHGENQVVSRARKSIAGFKLREGVPVGCFVTLRGERMWEFFDRLVNVAVPRIRDFRGLSLKSFDGRGNYSFGVREQIIFPEICHDVEDFFGIRQSLEKLCIDEDWRLYLAREGIDRLEPYDFENSKERFLEALE